MLFLYTLDGDDEQHVITDARGLSWSTHYGEQGSGFGYLKFSLPRRVGTDYADIGYGFDIVLTKHYTNVLFDGQIRQIEESSSPDRDELNVTALGRVVIAGDEEFNRHYCDTRLNMWKMSSELPQGAFRPDYFNIGRADLGLYMHTSNDKELSSGDYTELEYTFTDDESAQRFKADLSLHLGSGSVFDGQVDSIDLGSGFIYYKNDSGESQLAQNMLVYNTTQAKTATISAVDTGTNKITVTVPSALGGWVADDELAVYGPLFYAQIQDISTDTITYENDIGESNLASSQTLADVSKKSIATIQSYNTTSNTITVSDEDHIVGWEVGDVIIVGAPYFEATYSSKSGVTVTYSSPIGERIASSATGWVLYNSTEDEYATVASWNIGSNQLDVIDSGDLTANWTSGDTLRIYTPFRVKVLESDDTLIWPSSDWRQGAVPHSRTAISVTTSGNPDGLKIRLECYVAGTGDESSFAMYESLKAYSTTSGSTAQTLATDVVGLLSVSGHGLSSSTSDIASVTKTLEPMFFEFKTLSEAMAWACYFGDSNGDRIAWGIRLNRDKVIFLEVQDGSTVDYVIRRSGPANVSVSGDIQNSWQQVRGIYADKLGDQQMTAWQSDSGAYFNSKYRRKSISLDSVDTDAEAVSLISMFLNENKNPKTSAKYSISTGAVFTEYGVLVPFDEIKATGRIMMIEDWRAAESTSLGSDIRDSWTREQIVAVEVNYDQGSATLTPASAKSDFERYMAELSRLAEV